MVDIYSWKIPMFAFVFAEFFMHLCTAAVLVWGGIRYRSITAFLILLALIVFPYAEGAVRVFLVEPILDDKLRFPACAYYRSLRGVSLLEYAAQALAGVFGLCASIFLVRKLRQCQKSE